MRGDAEQVEQAGQRLGEPAAAADQDGAVDERGALGVALELGGAREPEVLDEQLADRRTAEALVAVAHGGACPPVSRGQVAYVPRTCHAHHVTPCVTQSPHFVTWPSLPSLAGSRAGKDRHMNTSTRRVAVIGGNRIPFARSNTAYADASNQEMLTAAHRRPGDPVRARGRAARRGRRRRRAQALPRLQPGPRVGARLEAVARDAGDRHPAGLRHRPPGRDPGRQQDRARPDRGRHRRRHRHHVRRAGRDQRQAAQEADEGQRRPRHQGSAGQGARRDPARRHRPGDPAERRAAHPAVDGRARRADRAGVADRPRGAGRARRRLAPAPRRGVRRAASSTTRSRRSAASSATTTCAPTRRSRSSPSSSRSSARARRPR